MFSGCFFPEELNVDLRINSDLTYEFEYTGTMAFISAIDEINAGKVSKKSENEFELIGAELLKELGFRRIKYIGKGRFTVYYTERGNLNEEKKIFGKDFQIFTISPKNGAIKFEGIKLSRDDIKQVRAKQLDFRGKITIKSDLEVMDHNADNVPILGFGEYSWNLDTSSTQSAYFLTSNNPKSSFIPVIAFSALLFILCGGIYAFKKTRKQ
jgi:hypothetical protein